MISFNLNYFLKIASPNTVTLEVLLFNMRIWRRQDSALGNIITNCCKLSGWKQHNGTMLQFWRAEIKVSPGFSRAAFLLEASKEKSSPCVLQLLGATCTPWLMALPHAAPASHALSSHLLLPTLISCFPHDDLEPTQVLQDTITIPRSLTQSYLQRAFCQVRWQSQVPGIKKWPLWECIQPPMFT